ncbi:O-antigen ligase family protein [Pseudalkalibacillus sp. R45]|uniref:O-antigen ligase family protein n=1 Tax=Pseudalkalibacillus sp. R45 TaxID=3457433 RepID=UPI003FCC2961
MKNSKTVKEVFNLKLLDYLIALYFFLTPLEPIVNVIIPGGSSVKYVGGILLVVFLLHSYKYQLKHNIFIFHFLILIWLLITTLSYFYTTSTNYALIYLPTYISITVFFILLTTINYHQRQIKLFIMSTLYGSTILAIFMLSSMTLYHGKGIRYSLSILNAEIDPNNIAAFLAYGVLISFNNTFMKKNNKLKNIVFLIINIIALFYTGSRGAFITIGFALIILSIYKFRSNGRYYFSIKSIAKSMLVLTIVVVFLNIFVPESLLSRILEFTSYESGSERTNIWAFAIERLASSPLIGYGVGSFPEVANTYYGIHKGMHNTFLMVLFEVGIVGFIFFVSFIINLFLKAINQKHYFALAILFTALIPSLFLDSLVKRFFWNGLILCYILVSEVNSKAK